MSSVDNSGTPNVPHVVLAQGYDLGGDMTSQAATINGTADFANSFAFNADQQLTTVQQQDVNGGDVISPKELDYSYNTIGQFSGMTDFNYIGAGPRLDTLTGTYSYDTADRLTGLDYTSNGRQTAIDNYSWAYNAGNLVTSFTTDTGAASYAYDATNQITSANYSGTNQPANESYSYDPNGNRDMAGYSTAADNIVASDGTFNYQHDADGNITVRTRISDAYASDYKTEYTYDYRNRLTDVEYYDNNGVLTKHVHYVFDVFDNLIGEEDDDTGDGSYDDVQWYAVDASPSMPAAGQPPAEGAQPLLQFNSSGAVTERNLVGLNPAGVDAIMAQEAVDGVNQGGAVTWMVDDNLGSDRNVVNNSGNVVDTTVYNAFGQTASQSNPSAAAWTGFAGGHNDASTSMVLDAERAYNPTTGDWNSKDPIGFEGGDANTGRYGGNSPTNAIDPTGLWAQYQVTAIMTGGSFRTSNGWMGDYWSIALSDGYYASGSAATPGLTIDLSAPTFMVASYYQWSGPLTLPGPAAAAPPTSVYSLMLENDPTLASRIHEAQGQAQLLASASITFTAAGPMIFALPGGGGLAAAGPKGMQWAPVANPLPWVLGAGIVAQSAMSQSNHGLTPGASDVTPVQPPQAVPQTPDSGFSLEPYNPSGFPEYGDPSEGLDSGSQVLPPDATLGPDNGWGPFGGPWENPVK